MKEQKKRDQKGFKQIKFPWKHKFVFNPKWVDKSFTLEGKKLTLSMGIWDGKRQSGLKLTLPKVPLGRGKRS